MTAPGALTDVAIAVASAPLLFASGYLALLALLARPRPAPPPAPGHARFDVIVPAHDEEVGIAATVMSLLALEYPPDDYRVIVVADNCSDGTADRARAAGATVFVREDGARRGKGYALAHAFERILADGRADAAVVVDADSTASANLLEAFSRRISSGAGVLQAEYGVLNPTASWRTRLMVIALALFHVVRSLGRERLGCSAGLRGNGMCFTVAALKAVPPDAFSIVEDIEYGIRLGQAGYRVEFVNEARVLGEMVSSEKGSRSQRRRWESGRMALARTLGPGLLRQAIARRSLMLLDLAIDLLVPPLTYLVGAALVGTVASIVWLHAAGHGLLAAGPWALSLGLLALYVAKGVWSSGTGLRGLLALAWAPVYMVWKIALVLLPSRRGKGEWIRTERQGEPK